MQVVFLTIVAWKMFFHNKNFPKFDSWLKYLEIEKIKFITKDQWFMLYEFAALSQKGNEQTVIEEGCWPLIIDKFVKTLK